MRGFLRFLLVLLEIILAFVCLLTFGQLYSWLGFLAVVLGAAYALLLIWNGVRIRRYRKQADHKAAGKSHALMVALLLLPFVLVFSILVWAFSAM